MGSREENGDDGKEGKERSGKAEEKEGREQRWAGGESEGRERKRRCVQYNHYIQWALHMHSFYRNFTLGL